MSGDKLTVGYDSMPAEHHAYYDPEGLVGRGKTREDAVADLLEQTDEAWGAAMNERDAARKALPRWIPVAERLPDADGSVLGALKGDSEPVWLVYHDGADWVTAEGSVCQVTHWMALPEEPK